MENGQKPRERLGRKVANGGYNCIRNFIIEKMSRIRNIAKHYNASAKCYGARNAAICELACAKENFSNL